MSYDRIPHRRLLLLTFGVVAALSIFMVSGAVSLTDDASVAQQAEPEGIDDTTDLADADDRFVGEGENDTAGWAVASAGDVNGDGVQDLVIGAPRNDSAGENAGAAYIVYGPADPGDVDLGDADVKLTGVEANDFAGWSVSSAGDLNDDGYAEVVVGAPGKDIEPADEWSTGNNSGAAYVVYGSEDLSGEVSLDDAQVTIDGGEEYDHAGWTVDNVSAVGEEGNPGIVVGAPDQDAGGTNAGAAYLLANDTLDVSADDTTDAALDLDDETRGDDASERTLDLDADADARVTGIGNGSNAGYAVADAGDVDDDAADELIVGAPGYNASAFQTEPAGAAYVVDANVSGNVSLDDANRTFLGANPGDRAGYAVSGAADVNDDDVADVIVGAPGNDAGGNETGAAYVVHGSEDADGELNLSEANATLVGPADLDQAGWSVSSTDAVGCDDTDDVIVGVPYANSDDGYNAGIVYLVDGADGLDGTQNLSDAAARFVGEDRGDRAGWSVASAGDWDDDGYQDVIVGAMYNDANADNAGAAYVVQSGCEAEEPVTEDTATPTETPEPTDTPTATPPETPNETEATPEMPNETEVPAGEPNETEAPPEMPNETEAPPETPNETEAPPETPNETEAPPETPNETEAPPETPNETEAPPEAPNETEAPADVPNETGAPAAPPDMSTTFSGCTGAQIYGIQPGDPLIVQAVSEDGDSTSETFIVQQGDLQGSEGNQYFAVSVGDFAPDGWYLIEVEEPTGDRNPNVDQDGRTFSCTG